MKFYHQIADPKKFLISGAEMKYSSLRLLTSVLSVFCLFSLSSMAQPNNTQSTKVSSADIQQAILKEVNEARANPQSFVPYLENYRKLFKGNMAYYADGKMVTTIEGMAVIDEAIAYLKKLSTLPPYAMSKGLSTAATAQVTDLMENSALGHYGKDGSDLPTRLKKFGSYGTTTSENITYFPPLARDIVMAMIIDDGVKNRGHRKNIFSANLKQIGLAFGQSKKGENLCVVIFADSFKEGATIPTDKRLKAY